MIKLILLLGNSEKLLVILVKFVILCGVLKFVKIIKIFVVIMVKIVIILIIVN